MKIISWNVNGLHSRLDAVNRLADKIQPDIMCFQKVRSKGCFIINMPRYMGWLGPMNDGLFGGVSTYLRNGLKFDFKSQRNDIPKWLLETTCINVIHFEKFILVNAYFPYANAGNKEFVKIRQRWDYEFHDYILKLTKQKPVILCGDLNIVSEPIDAWDGVNIKNAGCFFPWEHRNFKSMVKQARLVDTYRQLHPNKQEFSYFFQNRPEYILENKGFRIDYMLVDEELMPYVTKSEIMTEVTDVDSRPLLLDINI